MYRVKMHLSDPNTKGESLILFQVSGNGITPFEICSNISIAPKYWNSIESRIITKGNEIRADKATILLNRYSLLCSTITALESAKREITLQAVSSRLYWANKSFNR